MLAAPSLCELQLADSLRSWRDCCARGYFFGGAKGERVICRTNSHSTCLQIPAAAHACSQSFNEVIEYIIGVFIVESKQQPRFCFSYIALSLNMNAFANSLQNNDRRGSEETSKLELYI